MLVKHNKVAHLDDSESDIDPKITIVIPTLNEAGHIGRLIKYLHQVSDGENIEILVVDGQSKDNTPKIAREGGARVVTSLQKGRAVQMNIGAKAARGDILYFLHADTYPPNRFDQYIKDSFRRGFKAGCFELGFDQNHPLLKFYSWFTKIDFNAFRFGDQSLYIDAELFKAIDGYDESLTVMEDNDIVYRIKKNTPFKIMSGQVTTSARRYKRNGIIRLQLIFTLIYLLHHLGVSQRVLTDIYKRWIR